MEEDLILQQPADRRLGNVNALPPGPPGAEFDTVDFDSKNAPRTIEKESSSASKSNRRRSPSGSPLPKRKSSPMRSRRSPSPPPVGRRRRSPSPRRNRYREYSPPDRRRYDSGRSRRTPDRRRSPPSRDPRMAAGRDRFRGRGGGRGRSGSRSRSPSDRRGGGGGSRWSPKKKPNSPTTNVAVQPAVTQQQRSLSQSGTGGPTQAQYGVMAPQIYGGDAYGSGPAYSQYSVPPPQTGFAPQNDAYVMQQQAAAPPAFNAAYPPPPTWGVNVQDAYGQQTWMQQPVPDPIQMQQIQQAPPPTVAAQVQLAPPPIAAPQSMSVLTDAAPGTVEPNPAHDAVAQEAENQRDELKKQRSSYLKKTSVLKKELKMLKEQRRDLNSGGPPPSPTTKGFIDENEKLQNQIEKKLSTIENVIDMLTGIIGEENLEKDLDEATDSDATKNGNAAKQRDGANTSGVRSKKKRTNTTSSSDSSSGSSTSSSTSSSSSSSSENEDDDSSPERLKNKVMESMKSKQKEGIRKDVVPTKAKEEKPVDEKKRFNYVFYDPEMHWCQTCDIFPKTAKDFLNHLHTKEHMDRESIDTPWHLGMVNDQYPTYDNAPVKRTPIRGLTFFVPATAWFCKLCNTWMGDLHCASSHLRSPGHSNRYNVFLEKNPHFEVDWLADRQRILNEKKAVPLPPQITSVSTTAEHGSSSKKSKKDDDKSKKRKKKGSDKKDKKKKKKRSKKRKKATTTSSSSSSDSSSSESEQPKKKKSPPIVIKELDNPNPAASIRVAMRKQEGSKVDDEVPPPAPPMVFREEPPPPQVHVNVGRIGKWTVAQESGKATDASQERIATIEEDSKRDDAMIQQWNTVQPVISESEKKLLEQLKGKLKNKPRDEPAPNAPSSASAGGEGRNPFSDGGKDNRDRSSMRGNSRRDLDTDRRRRRSPSPPYGGRAGRSRTRSRSRGRGGVDYRRGRRTHSRSRGRNSPGGGWGGRRRRSRSRSLRRRSRSHDRRRRSSRSRSRSGSRTRIEKAVVRHSEFRPRVPEKEKEKKPSESKDKKDATKKAKSTTAAAAAAASGKKLPFIGKMPVFKKQSSGQIEGGDKRPDENPLYLTESNGGTFGLQSAQRVLAPTAAQIQMAMMEDVYGNAPPFHPDAGMMVDYDDLMPDPVQFVNLMGQAPPPPPPTSGQSSGKATEVDDDADILPPGIDEMETEEFVPKPIVDPPLAAKGALPKDLEDALNIIFPGEKKPGEEEAEAAKKARSSGETQIIVDEPVMQAADLAKDGIHMITIEETSIAGMDEASQLSMNEPLVFNKPNSSQVPASPIAPPQLEDTSSQNAADIDLSLIQPPPPVELSELTTTAASTAIISPNNNDNVPIILENIEVPIIVPAPADIPIPKEDETSAVIYDLDDIPQPPASPTESEKNRRQEELDDLAMLGIDADDMAAQCI